MDKKFKDILIIIAFFAVILTALVFLIQLDNKYTTKMPLPQEGTLFLTSDDLDAPVFLIDEWQLSDGTYRPETSSPSIQTWIGEFSNYRHQNDRQKSPYGTGTYQLQIQYDGDNTIAGLFFPQLANSYRIWWDDSLISEGWARDCQRILLTEGIHTLTVEVTSDSGYYAGMYFPGAIGSDHAISRLTSIQTVIYGASALIPLVLAGFCFSLWARTKNRLRFRFAMLCVSYAVSLCHYFMQFWNGPISTLRYLISDLAIYAMFYFAVAVMTEIMNPDSEGKRPLPLQLTLGFSVVSVGLYLLFPLWPNFISFHGTVQNIYRIVLFVLLIHSGVLAMKSDKNISRLTLLCGGALGITLLANLVFSNQFEPIYGMWQFEWCGLLLVGLFGAVMEEHNRKLILENQMYQEHLEELVEERTQQLNFVLEERRAFFSDMAHDLKAPLSSLKGFIHMIRSHDVGLDNELAYYLDQVEQQQKEMSRRVGSLNELNSADRLTSVPEQVAANDLLQELHHIHNPEAVVNGIHLLSLPSENTPEIRVQKQKLMLAFENMIYNSLRFTPAGGTIVLAVEDLENEVRFSVSDTGCGISEEDLPHVFERFYMGHEGQESGGSGLGLYIAKTIVNELGGTISAESIYGKGTKFTIVFPKIK